MERPYIEGNRESKKLAFSDVGVFGLQNWMKRLAVIYQIRTYFVRIHGGHLVPTPIRKG